MWPPGASRTKKTVGNPMATRYPGMNFLNSNELVLGRILRNDSKVVTLPCTVGHTQHSLHTASAHGIGTASHGVAHA